MASYGVIDGFMAAKPHWDLHLSVTTATARELAEKRFGADRVSYFPLDFSWMVRRAFDKIRPNVIVLMELEIWPHFLEEAGIRHVPVIIANARITSRSAKRWGYWPSMVRKMDEAVSLWLPQTAEYSQRLTAMGIPATKIEVVGSVKYDAVPESLDLSARLPCRQELGVPPDAPGMFNPLLVAGSVHPGEDVAVLEAWRKQRTFFPTIRVFMAPRHPERVAEMLRTARSFGPAMTLGQLRSTPPGRNASPPPIVIGDTMGELGRFYAAADVVFVGGTLLPHGGQNFMEPCGLARPTICGPNLWNFQEPADLLRQSDGMVVIPDSIALSNAVFELLSNPKRAEEMGKRARAALLSKRGATRRTVDKICEASTGGFHPPPPSMDSSAEETPD